MRVLLILLTCLMAFPASAKTVQFILFQMNDVYEIAPVSGGQYGGLARVQTVLNELRQENSNIITILPGDFINPSAIGTAKVEGKRINGEQMVSVLNAMKWDYATLGNHEFDNGKETLQERIDQSHFLWFSSNVAQSGNQKPFPKTEKTTTFMLDGIKIGLFGITLQSLSKDFIEISSPLESAKKATQKLRMDDKVDVLLAVTHQSIEDDIALAKAMPEIDLILGGHEHENIYMRRGEKLTPIAKADANARSVYIHRVAYDTETQKTSIESELKLITEAIQEDPTIKQLVDEWIEKAFTAFEADGIQPREIVTTLTDTLNGIEADVRNEATNLTDLMAQSALHAFPGTQASLFNAGSIRIDDVLPPGPITQYDVLRILPFGGDYSKVNIPGDILQKALEVGLNNRGTGGFLHYANLKQNDDRWYIGDQTIRADQTYPIAIASFLIERGDSGLGFLVNNNRIEVVNTPKANAQKALIDELRHAYGTD